MITALSLLAPSPQRLETTGETYTLPQRPLIYLATDAASIRSSGETLEQALARRGLSPELTATDAGGVQITLGADPALLTGPESYRLVIVPEGITVMGGDEAGLFYGVQTLLQILRLYPPQGGTITLPGLRITDWPDFPHRGLMLDVSRDKVPTMETLFQLVDLLASLKINQLQLYTEHTFAYRGHEVVWEKASPLTGEEILTLDAYCQERFIELVPNQNSFGHMHRWLKHDRYRPLAELPEGWRHPFSQTPEPYSLCPLDPGSLELLRDLYDQLLPHFSSHQFNVGLDETFDLGMGRSKEACEQRGKERVYLEFLLKIYREVKRRGRVMQFWGDIVLHRPELIQELPKDVIALEWGYDAEHPFDEHTKLFAAAGLSFYVCPGTSSWNTIAGRTENALINLSQAAIHGRANGAVGYLNTDWGDNGHMQPLPVSFLGYLAGAAFSWNAGEAQRLDDLDIPALLDAHIFRDRARVMGRLAYNLGNAYLQPGIRIHNSSPLFWVLLFTQGLTPQPGEDVPPIIQRYLENILKPLADADFDRALAYIDQVTAELPQAQMERPDGELIQEEFAWAADLLRFAARLGKARQEAGLDLPVRKLPEAVRGPLAAELQELIQRHRRLWLARNRPGGLDDSAGRLERLLAALEGRE